MAAMLPPTASTTAVHDAVVGVVEMLGHLTDDGFADDFFGTLNYEDAAPLAALIQSTGDLSLAQRFLLMWVTNDPDEARANAPHAVDLYDWGLVWRPGFGWVITAPVTA